MQNVISHEWDEWYFEISIMIKCTFTHAKIEKQVYRIYSQLLKVSDRGTDVLLPYLLIVVLENVIFFWCYAYSKQ